jgi:CBS domain-containing protein
VSDIAAFLREHEPFGELDDGALARVAARAEVEEFPAGEVILRQGEPAPAHARIVRHGSVELVDHGRVLDRLGEGEWFGHPAMLSELPAGADARAAEDTVVYRLAADDVLALLARPAGLRFVARSLLARARPGAPRDAIDWAPRPDLSARDLLREALVTCPPETPIRDAARRMADGRASCIVIPLASGQLGILTDHDLRVRVVAEGMSVDAPVSAVMSAPAVTADCAALGTELMLTMVDRGVRHLPVVSERIEVIGVVTDVDLLAAEARTPLIVRRAIDDARDVDELRRAAARLLPTVAALHEGHLAATQISAIMAAVVDAAARRLIDLRLPDEPLPPFAWLSLGSYGRREPAPSSDIDSALTWDGEAPPGLAVLAEAVVDDLERAGFARDPHAANAANRLFARSATDWRSTITQWLEHPGAENVLIAVSLLADGRVVARHGQPSEVLDVLAEGRHHPLLLRLLKRLAVTYRPPTGFLRDIGVEHDGEYRGHFNIKRGGLLPIVDIARYAGVAAGSRSTSTVERLRAAGAAGILEQDPVTSLGEAFDLFTELRLDHQVQQLRAGQRPDDFVDPKSLNPLTRRYVREAFRVVTAAQRALSNELVYG